jgi:hypothetical protein
MQKVYRFFSTITAKYPKNVGFPKDMWCYEKGLQVKPSKIVD